MQTPQDHPQEAISWKGKIACQYIYSNLRLDTSQVKTSVNSYIYAFFEKGSAKILYDKKEVTVQPGDFMFFPPHIPPVVLERTDDYEVICLIVSSNFVLDCPTARNLYQTASFTTNGKYPVLHLEEKVRNDLLSTLMSFMSHLSHPHSHTTEALQSLYGLMLSDLLAIVETNNSETYTSQHSYKLFVKFNELLRIHFREHHEISFYAEQLGISPRYLSMMTKQIAHTTVAAFINNHLMLEACWLLKTTDYSIQRISELLHFADQASFSKFFKRVNGRNPLQYRRDQEPHT